MLVPLSSLKIGMKGKIQSIDFEEQVKERFLAMGFVPGKDIELVHVSRLLPSTLLPPKYKFLV